MNLLVLADLTTNQLWYAAPLIVVVSLVYAATRHEQMGPILSHALRFGMLVVGFMGAILMVLIAVSQFGAIVLIVLALVGSAWWVVRAWQARRSRSHESSSPRNPLRAEK